MTKTQPKASPHLAPYCTKHHCVLQRRTTCLHCEHEALEEKKRVKFQRWQDREQRRVADLALKAEAVALMKQQGLSFTAWLQQSLVEYIAACNIGTN